MSSAGGRQSLLATCLVAATAVLAGCGGLADALRPTAYCSPEDPVVNPTSVAPGDEVQVVISGVGRHPECSSTLPGGARYGISIGSRVDGTGNDDLGSHYYSAGLVVLDPDDTGAAEATVRVPDDMPVGEAQISVDLQGAKTLCEIDPSASCAPHPFADLDIVG
ncbi:hypothetical protein [Isoptericola sp. NPDC057391]|uniref:hypothetical protein n=1 Tax=Isoptericola sp. NPDC057391 TaxID=3346117 RepID=UPI00363D58EF